MCPVTFNALRNGIRATVSDSGSVRLRRLFLRGELKCLTLSWDVLLLQNFGPPNTRWMLGRRYWLIQKNIFIPQRNSSDACIGVLEIPELGIPLRTPNLQNVE
jgi:hypothetical protein